jgi:hypothetical protein
VVVNGASAYANKTIDAIGQNDPPLVGRPVDRQQQQRATAARRR